MSSHLDLSRKQQSTALDPSLGKSSYGFMVPVKLSPAPARGGLSSTSSGGGGVHSGSGSSGSLVLTLFGDGYSWVDNTDYVVIA